MQELAIFWHPGVLSHATGEGFFEAPPSALCEINPPHPEGSARLRNMHTVLARGPISSRLSWQPGRAASDAELTLFHTAEYVQKLRAADTTGERFTSTSPFGAGSFEPVTLAAGTTLSAVTAILDGHFHQAHALVRPPGHHAGPATADGYCFVNNIGVAVRSALAQGLERIAVIDWDVHHGNGTQSGFYEEAEVLTVSLHMNHGAWGAAHPETGAVEERGNGKGHGYNLNLPLATGLGDKAYEAAMLQHVMPRVRQYHPQLIVVANGQDANQFDPNGRQLVTMAGFNKLGQMAGELAHDLCDGRLLSVQEGGYNISYAAYCLHACLDGLLGLESSLPDPVAFIPEDPELTDFVLNRLSSKLSQV